MIRGSLRPFLLLLAGYTSSLPLHILANLLHAEDAEEMVLHRLVGRTLLDVQNTFNTVGPFSLMQLAMIVGIASAAFLAKDGKSQSTEVVRSSCSNKQRASETLWKH